MRTQYRIWVSLYLVIMILLAACLMLSTWGVIDSLDAIILSLPLGKVLLTVLAALWVVSSFLILFMRAKKDVPKTVVIATTDHGQIRITLEALDFIAQRYVRGISAVRSLRCVFRPTQGGIAIKAHVEFQPDTEIPKAVSELQAGLKAQIERQSGICVEVLHIMVEASTAHNAVARVD